MLHEKTGETMLHEKILKRDDGSIVKIAIRFSSDRFFGEYGGYMTTVRTCARRLDMDGRNEYEVKKQLEHVTKEEILQAKLELWEKMKPTAFLGITRREI